MHQWHRFLLCLLFGLWLSPAHSQTPVTLNRSLVGHYDFEVTGGSFRTQPNSGNSCAITGSSTNPIAGIPLTATVLEAYLYWAASGSTVDNTAVLNGTTVTANRTYTATFPFGGTNYQFYSAVADVTALVSGNGSYTVSGVTVANGAPWCAVSVVMGGWSLVVVYEDAAEPLQAVNIYEGFDLFRGGSLTLTPSSFRVPASPIQGKYSNITWEGDPENSGPLGGFNELLSVNGTTINDGINPPGSNPTIQPFDGTINSLGIATSYGVDVDTYNITPLISAGDTSITSVYSSGDDLVLLSAEVISVTTEPFSDLSISKSHTGDFSVGVNGQYTIQVTNNGPEPDPNPINIADTLPAGLGFVSGVGGGWTCGATGQDVTCSHAGPLAVGASLPDLTITVDVQPAAIPSVTNTTTVSSLSTDNVPGNDSASDPTNVLGPDLSTSQLFYTDLNGGDANPGDTLRFTLDIIESNGAPALNVSVTEDMPALVQNLTVTTLPAGANDSSTGNGTGANGTGFLDVNSFTVPANTTVTLEFEVDIINGATPGDIIALLLDILSSNAAPVVVPSANIVVSQSQVTSTGVKTLYLFDLATADPNGFNQGPQPYLSRTPPAGAQNNVIVIRNNPVTWTMTPALQQDLTISAGTIPVTLIVSKGGDLPGPVDRQYTVTLNAGGAPLGAPVVLNFLAPRNSTPQVFVFPVPLAVDTTIPAGSQITLTVDNTTPQTGNRPTRVFPVFGGNNSRVEFDSLTVINVDSVSTFDAAFPGGLPVTQYSPGDTVFVRAVVSDPFGSFDVASANIDISDSGGTPQVTGQAMTEVADNGVATKIFEYQYTIPGGAANGTWTINVVANEGTEGTVTDSGPATFEVQDPVANLVIVKSVQVISDPLNNTTNPYSIPGSTHLYTITISNQGPGTVDNNTLSVTDVVPANTSLFVDTSGGDPIVFVDGATASGLTYTFATDVGFSNQPGGSAPFNYVPVPDADGFDANVTGFQVLPQGVMNGEIGGNQPSFDLLFTIRVD